MPGPAASSSSAVQQRTGDEPPQDDQATLNRKPSLKTKDGQSIDIEGLNVPEAVKHLLTELDMDNSGEVSEQNLTDTLLIMKHMKQGLDVDGSGGVTKDEMEAGVQLLTKLMQDKAHNAHDIDYKYMPECIQDVMKEWDADGSGKVTAGELAAAAKAFKQIQKEGRQMKKIIMGLAVVILLLMAGMFILSLAAAEMAKEMKGGADGTMSTPTGVVVKVASSDFELAADGSMVIRGSTTPATCPAGQTCRRLGQDRSADSLKVAQAETPRRLSSTLPDSVFKELKSLTLGDSQGHSIKVQIDGYQRLSLRSSRCGSVVHLLSPSGRLTLDDYDMTADEAMEKFVADAGMSNLFEGPVSGFGRRLSSTDGMLEGFFNLLNDVEWACESVDLPSPDDIPQFYHAHIRVKHMHEDPAEGYSHLFTDMEDNALMMPGVIEEDGRVLKVWEERLVKVGGITAYISQFDNAPFVREFRLKRGLTQMRFEAMGTVGYRCEIEGVPPSAMANVANSDVMPQMTFMGVVVDKGVVLRHWRMYTGDDDDDEVDDPANASMTKDMSKAGIVPDTIDYFDVDTDPSDTFKPGQPYRIRLTSSVPGSRIFTEKQYLSLDPLPSTFEVQGVMDKLGLEKLDTKCRVADNLVNDTNAFLLLDDVAFLEVTNRSLVDPEFRMPPTLYPWREMPKSVIYNYDRFLKIVHRGKKIQGVEGEILKRSRYWSELVKNSHNRELLDFFRPQPAEIYPEWLDENTTSPPGGPSRRLGTWTAGETEGSYTVAYSSADLRRHTGNIPERHQARRLASARRLADFEAKAEITSEKINIEVEVGKASFQLLLQYCHLVTPELTNWGACQTGRHGAGDIIKVEAYASGKQVVWPFPTVNLEMGGLLVYDDTAAMSIDQDDPVYIRSIAARGLNLQDNNGNMGMGGNGGWETFQLVDASGGIQQFATDMRVWIRSHRGKYLQDNGGTLKWSSQNRGWEKWRILDGGSGTVYLKSHRGAYLAVQETSQPQGQLCRVIIYASSNCRGSSKVLETTNSAGQEFKLRSDNWESARAEGKCSQVEFYDEDEDESMYEDNQWKLGTFGCFNFKSDLDDDMSGVKIWAEGPLYPPWEGNVRLTWEKNDDSRWQLLKTDGEASAVSFGDPLLYGGLTFKKEMEIIWDIKASFTTEIAAGGAVHPQHGAYLAEVYGKGILEMGPLQMWLQLKFNPDEPWYTKYRDWTMCIVVGYEVDTWFYTYRDDYTIWCEDLNFR